MKIKILLVEDSKLQAEYSKTDLQSISPDIVVEIVETVKDALRAAQASPLPDLIILDMNLPDGSGLDVCRRVKSFTHTRAIPLVIFSTEPLSKHRQDAYAAGADQYITKGSTGDSTLKLVASTLLRDKLRRVPKLGEALVELGYLKIEDLKRALEYQQKNHLQNKMIGQVLVDMGLVTLDQIFEALKRQQH